MLEGEFVPWSKSEVCVLDDGRFWALFLSFGLQFVTKSATDSDLHVQLLISILSGVLIVVLKLVTQRKGRKRLGAGVICGKLGLRVSTVVLLGWEAVSLTVCLPNCCV